MCIGPFAPSAPSIPPPPPPPVLPELPDPANATVAVTTAAARKKARQRAALAIGREDRNVTGGLISSPTPLKTTFGT